tara:strand:- start:2589 stop:2819 length:231 start_codon:yes stop_codon:yes gene_type:complete
MIYKMDLDKKIHKPDQPEYEVTPEDVGKFIGVFLLGPLLLMVCWNGLMPYLFGLKSLNYLHAFCMIVLTRFITSSD